MLRRQMIGILVAVLAMLALGCGGDSVEKGAMKAGDVERARAQLQELQTEMAEVRRQVNDSIVDLETEQMRLQARLKDIQAGFEKLNARATMLNRALEGRKVPAKEKAASVRAEKKQEMSWYTKALIVIVVVVGVLWLVLHNSRSGSDEDDSEFEDDEVVENNDLGEIRYPGAAQAEDDEDDEEDEESDDEKPQ